MDIRLGCVVVFVTLLCALAIGRCEGRSKSEDSNFFFNNDIPPRIIEEMWEQLRSNCKHDFMQMKSIIEAFGIYIDEDNSIDSKEQVITKVNLQSFINVVPPHLKRSLLDCLQKQNIPVLVSGEEVDSKKWYVSYIESLFGWSDASRRYLGENRLHGTAHSLPLAPALALAPNPAQAPSPAFESPTYAPEQSSGLAPASLYVPNPGPAEEPSASPDINPNEAYSGDLQSSASPSFAPDVPNPGPAEEPSASPDINPNEAYSGDLQSSASPSFAPDPPPKPHTYLQVAVAVGGTAAGTFAFALVFVACLPVATLRSSEYRWEKVELVDTSTFKSIVPSFQASSLPYPSNTTKQI